MPTLEQASLSAGERRALGDAVDALQAELGDELLAVWLYGSRARGERTGEDSDIDLLVVVSDRRRLGRRAWGIVYEAAGEAHSEAFVFSTQVTDPRELAQNAAIESLYLHEVERDRVVLKGGEVTPLADLAEHELPAKIGRGGVMTRSLEWLDMARRHLDSAERALEAGLDGSVIASMSYYGMLYSARAALSEEGRVARKHAGTWNLMREIFVEGGRFDAGLVKRAQEMQEHREGADYKGWTFERDESEAHVADARRFLAAIERLIGAKP